MDKTEHIYSAEIKEIVGEPPKWLLKSGGGSLLLLLLLLLALSAFTHYPDKKAIAINIYREQNPLILSKSLNVCRFLKTSGAQAKKGEAIALADRDGIKQIITAPFTGKLFYADGALTETHKKDTLAMLVPSKGGFKFKGQISSEYARLLNDSKNTAFKITPNNLLGDDLELYGKLTTLGPLKTNNMFDFTGTIEPASGNILDQKYVAVLNLDARLTLVLENKTILSRILN
ncbi:hypothetical protein [Pedobacter zeae]|uniref:HlyD family secretion protein n=1 Tax=Pedobacter zeae TaxID=1737356 RepID=A0A7W6KFN5_9SPHI|nr:hypothetical protein [Pedobacter zeae]MBB4109667.1 hypothetical protein [Pedobacter zeae]GGH13536.1 hypothetical protein GCM10007422_34230 [Pedobacter zeae]